ncbi:MAG: hypothetical protein V9E83_11685 [Baekduia sp.]
MLGRALASAVIVASAAALPAQAASCKKLKEASGCKLPNGTSYQYSRSDTDEMNLTVDRGKAQITVRSACAFERSRRFAFKSVPKVGKTYTFTETKTENVLIRDEFPVTYTYKLTLKVKIESASKATTSGSATTTAPAVPPQGSFEGEDAFNANCGLKKTLKRVKA